MMKNFLAVMGLITLLITFGHASASNALTIRNYTNKIYVGDIDLLLYATALANSGKQTELDWVNKELNLTPIFTTFDKTEDKDSGWNWIKTNENPDVLAFDLALDGGYFLIKTGNFNIWEKNDNKNVQLPKDVKIDDSFLFRNNSSENWAVVALSDIAERVLRDLVLAVDPSIDTSGWYVQSFDVEKLSHITEFPGNGGPGPGPSPIPEPVTMLLFGTGLLGLAGVARRKTIKLQ